jgi:hypothetical protein
MSCTDSRWDQTDDEDIFTHDVSDEALANAGDDERDNAVKITWYYCPTGLTICRV